MPLVEFWRGNYKERANVLSGKETFERFEYYIYYIFLKYYSNVNLSSRRFFES